MFQMWSDSRETNLYIKYFLLRGNQLLHKFEKLMLHKNIFFIYCTSSEINVTQEEIIDLVNEDRVEYEIREGFIFEQFINKFIIILNMW